MGNEILNEVTYYLGGFRSYRILTNGGIDPGSHLAGARTPARHLTSSIQAHSIFSGFMLSK
jgi:hypothetical protein